MRLQELNQQLLQSHAQGRCNVRAQTAAYHVCRRMSQTHPPACAWLSACSAAAQFKSSANSDLLLVLNTCLLFALWCFSCTFCRAQVLCEL
jgi:hypothetical protein